MTGINAEIDENTHKKLKIIGIEYGKTLEQVIQFALDEFVKEHNNLKESDNK